MESKSDEKELIIFNKYHWAFEWPKIWIITLAILLIGLDLIILGMEIGHTVSDVYRSTAFGGIIVFLPLLTSSIFVLITAFYPRLVLLRTASVLSIVMIVLCIILIDYDIIVLIDPTRCFFLDCNFARVDLNSTSYVTGWPLTISWPTSFQSSMNAKRIFQSVQILAAALFILFSICFILTFVIYRNLDLYCQTTTNDDREPSILSQRSEPKTLKEVIVYRSRPESMNNYEKLCTRCLRETRLRSSHLCRNCSQSPIQIRPTTVIVKRRHYPQHRWYDFY